MVLHDGNARQFDDLYRRHCDDVFRTCMRFAAGDRAWAMDRAHDAFVTLAEKLDGLDKSEELGGWLYRVAVNACLMDLRRQRGWRTLFGALSGRPEPVDDMERSVGARRDASRFETALAELPAEQRAVMALVHLDGASQTEAAELLGLSKGYVSKLHSRALASLRERDWEIDGAADA